MSDKSLRPEYAFIWNPNVLELERDPEIFKGISERVSKRFDAYIIALSMMLTSFLFSLSSKKKNGNKKEKEEEEEEDAMFRNTLTGLGLGGLMGAGLASGNAGMHADDTCEEDVRKQIADTLHKNLRPPLIGIFKKKKFLSCGIGEKEIRIINMHSYFGDDSKESKKIRMRELSFVLWDIFDVVATQRDGKWRYPTTIVAGDYNMSLADIQKMSDMMLLPEIHKNRSFTTGQTEPTTVSIKNKEKVQEGEPPQIEHVSNYDHFSYDRNNFSSGDPLVDRIDVTNENFIVDKKLVSDHVPIEMTFDF